MTKNKFYYAMCCKDLRGDDVVYLERMVSGAQAVTYGTLKRNCKDLELVEKRLGYEKGIITMAKDPKVKFHKSRYGARPCYFLTYSRTEYIFMERL